MLSMPVEYVTGDLFRVEVSAIGHGVNCVGAMGSGIAPLFKGRWPDMYAQYRDVCRAGGLHPGGLFPYRTPDGRTILNMATQYRTGRDARLDWVEDALRAACHYCENEHIDRFAIPRIGAGIGGLDWPDVKAVIEQVASGTPVTIVVVSLPDAT